MLKIKIIPISWYDSISITLIENRAGYNESTKQVSPNIPRDLFVESGKQIIEAMEDHHCTALLQSMIFACLDKIKEEEIKYNHGHFNTTKELILDYFNDK